MNWIKNKLRKWVAPNFNELQDKVKELQTRNDALLKDIHTLVMGDENDFKTMNVRIHWSLVFMKDKALSYGSSKNNKTTDKRK